MNAYEVRLEVLKLAQAILSTNKSNVNSGNNISTQNYTDHEVINSAKRLYSFVSTKGDSTE